jgi:uncharacterized repeat protein (TIGR03803 family)
MKRIVNALGKLNPGKRGYAVFVLCATTALALPAQTFTTLFSFYFTDGETPFGGLVQATDGNLYGTTAAGGANSVGTVFKITPSGNGSGHRRQLELQTHVHYEKIMGYEGINLTRDTEARESTRPENWLSYETQRLRLRANEVGHPAKAPGGRNAARESRSPRQAG